MVAAPLPAGEAPDRGGLAGGADEADTTDTNPNKARAWRLQYTTVRLNEARARNQNDGTECGTAPGAAP